MSACPPVDLVLFFFIFFRALALYSTYDGSRQGYFFYVGGNENKNKISWLADVGGEKIKKGKLSNWPIIFSENCPF